MSLSLPSGRVKRIRLPLLTRSGRNDGKMINVVFNTMMTLLLARFAINDLPHAAGLLSNPNEVPPTARQLRYVAILCQQLEIREPIEEHVRTGGEAGRLIRELEWEKKRRKQLKVGNPIPSGTCYEDAWHFLIKEEEGYLIHGTAISLGRRLGHAWVELPTGYVWEPYSGEYLTKERFQELVNPIEEHRYTVEEAAIMLARVGKHGPWSEEERAKWLHASYWVEADGRLYHSCHRGPRQLAPKPEIVISYGYYEDGYFRGMKKGRYSKFLDETAQENWIQCKACGERYVF